MCFEQLVSLLCFLPFLTFVGLCLLLTLLELCVLLSVVVDVEYVVDWAIPLLASRVNRMLELNSGFFLADTQKEGLFDKGNVRLVKLIQSCHEHQDEQVDENVSVLSDLEEGLTGQFFEGFFKIVWSESLRAHFCPTSSILALLVIRRVEEELELLHFLLLLQVIFLDIFNLKLISNDSAHSDPYKIHIDVFRRDLLLLFLGLEHMRSFR